MGLFPRKKGAVWSTSIKKQRLLAWQQMSHQLLSQLFLLDHMTVLVQDFADDSVLHDRDISNLQGTLGVIASVTASAERVATTWAHTSISRIGKRNFVHLI